MRTYTAILAIVLLVTIIGCMPADQPPDNPVPTPNPIDPDETGIEDVFEDPGDIEPPVIPSS